MGGGRAWEFPRRVKTQSSGTRKTSHKEVTREVGGRKQPLRISSAQWCQDSACDRHTATLEHICMYTCTVEFVFHHTSGLCWRGVITNSLCIPSNDPTSATRVAVGAGPRHPTLRRPGDHCPPNVYESRVARRCLHEAQLGTTSSGTSLQGGASTTS